MHFLLYLAAILKQKTNRYTQSMMSVCANFHVGQNMNLLQNYKSKLVFLLEETTHSNHDQLTSSINDISITNEEPL